MFPSVLGSPCIISYDIFQVFLALTAGGRFVQNKAFDTGGCPVCLNTRWRKLLLTFQSFSLYPTERNVVVKGTKKIERRGKEMEAGLSVETKLSYNLILIITVIIHLIYRTQVMHSVQLRVCE